VSDIVGRTGLHAWRRETVVADSQIIYQCMWCTTDLPDWLSMNSIRRGMEWPSQRAAGASSRWGEGAACCVHRRPGTHSYGTGTASHRSNGTSGPGPPQRNATQQEALTSPQLVPPSSHCRRPGRTTGWLTSWPADRPPLVGSHGVSSVCSHLQSDEWGAALSWAELICVRRPCKRGGNPTTLTSKGSFASSTSPTSCELRKEACTNLPCVHVKKRHGTERNYSSK